MKKIIITAVNKKYLHYAQALEQSVIENGCAEFRCYRIEDKAIRVSHSRAMLIRENLPFYDIVAWFDADILVVKSLKNFWKDIKPNTMKALYRPQQVKKRLFNSGVVAFGKGLETSRLIARWEKKLINSHDIYQDQLELYKAYKKHNVKLIKIDRMHNDHHFDDISYIWHNKLKDKSRAKKFFKKQKEFLKRYEAVKSHKKV